MKDWTIWENFHTSSPKWLQTSQWKQPIENRQLDFTIRVSSPKLHLSRLFKFRKHSSKHQVPSDLNRPKTHGYWFVSVRSISNASISTLYISLSFLTIWSFVFYSSRFRYCVSEAGTKVVLRGLVICFALLKIWIYDSASSSKLVLSMV